MAILTQFGQNSFKITSNWPSFVQQMLPNWNTEGGSKTLFWRVSPLRNGVIGFSFCRIPVILQSPMLSQGEGVVSTPTPSPYIPLSGEHPSTLPLYPSLILYLYLLYAHPHPDDYTIRTTDTPLFNQCTIAVLLYDNFWPTLFFFQSMEFQVGFHPCLKNLTCLLVLPIRLRAGQNSTNCC